MELIKKLEAEKSDLDKKIKKINHFMKNRNQKITVRQFDLIRQQRAVMKQYSQILNSRISDLKENE